MHVVLVEPEIPANTGNIARTCAVTGAHLHLVQPLGFSIADKYLKRAGLDYWHLLNVQIHANFNEVLQQYPRHCFYYATTKGARLYTHVDYGADDFLVFGKETAGLPQAVIAENINNTIRLPMLNAARSLNLSNAVAVVLYEALRQNNFNCLK